MRTHITIEALEALQAIDAQGSFAAAAEALYKVPSAVTYTIRKLEQDLGVTLFVKEGRRSVMTPAAKLILQQGKEILTSVKCLEKNSIELSNGWEPRLNIAIGSILGLNFLSPMLNEFYALRPQTEVNLYEEAISGGWEAISSGRVDLVIGASNAPLDNKQFAIKKIMSVTWHFAVAPDHPLTKITRPLTANDVKGYRFIAVRDSVHDLTPNLICLNDFIMSDLPTLSVPTVGDKIDAIQCGLGIGFLPSVGLDKIVKDNRVTILKVAAKERAPMDLYLAWKRGNQGKALCWFVSHFAQCQA